MDPDSCTNVLIQNCNILTSDDNISLKSGKGAAGVAFNVPTTNVRITGNRFIMGSGVAIGSEMSGGVHNVMVDNNIFDTTGNVVRFKSCPNYAGIVENVSYVNNTILAGASPIFIDMHYECSNLNTTIPDPVFRGIVIDNLHGDAAQAGYIACLNGACYDWQMNDVVFHKHILGYIPCENITKTVFNNFKPQPSCF